MAVESDTGMMGGTMAHEFMALTPSRRGHAAALRCDGCGYSANRQIATFAKPDAAAAEAPAAGRGSTRRASTPSPRWPTFWTLPESQTAKAVFLVAEVADDEDGETA